MMNDSMKKKALISNPKTKTQRAALEILNKEVFSGYSNPLCLEIYTFVGSKCQKKSIRMLITAG